MTVFTPKSVFLKKRESRRLEAVRAALQRRWADPQARADFAYKIRGFHVPPERAPEYRLLTRIKHIPMKEAGKMMGLI